MDARQGRRTAKRCSGFTAAGLALVASAAAAQPAGDLAPGRAYDARILSSAAAAERFQGPLDGGWTLSVAGKGDLYAVQLTDRGGQVEGAWRDLHGPARGLIDSIDRTPGGLALRFDDAVVTLDRRLQGSLQRAGRTAPVVLRRAAP